MRLLLLWLLTLTDCLAFFRESACQRGIAGPLTWGKMMLKYFCVMCSTSYTLHKSTCHMTLQLKHCAKTKPAWVVNGVLCISGPSIFSQNKMLHPKGQDRRFCSSCNTHLELVPRVPIGGKWLNGYCIRHYFCDAYSYFRDFGLRAVIHEGLIS